MTVIGGSHGPTTNVYIAKTTVPACPPHCCSPTDAMACCYSQLERTLPRVHPRTTYSFYAHASHMPGLYGVCSTDLQELNICFVITQYKHVTTNQNTRIPLDFLLFFVLTCNEFCSLVCAYCICQHLVSCGHCCVEFGFF